MIAYDSRTYYDKAREPFSDPEWEEAEKSKEKSEYYWVIRKSRGYAGFIRCTETIKYVKCYKPAVAKLVAERTGDILIPVFHKFKGDKDWYGI